MCSVRPFVQSHSQTSASRTLKFFERYIYRLENFVQIWMTLDIKMTMFSISSKAPFQRQPHWLKNFLQNIENFLTYLF